MRLFLFPFIRNAVLLFLFSHPSPAQDNPLAEKSHQAKELMAAGRYEEAIPIYRQLVAALPGNPGLVLNLGLAQQMAGHPDQAISQFQAVLKAQPGNVPALTSLSTAFLQMGRPAPAVAPLRKLVSLQPINRDARGMLAGALLSTDHAEEAANQYRRLTESDPADSKAWYGLGSAYEAAANTAFDRLTKLDVNSPYWAALVAETRLQRNQYRSAFFFYRHAEEAMPNLPGLHAGLAEVYRKTGHDDWAVLEQGREAALSAKACTAPTAECDFLTGKPLAAVERPAAQPASLFWKTKALNQLAREAFSRLGALPESPELHAIQASIFKAHDQYKEAAEQWRAALRLSPDDLRLSRELLTALFQARDNEALVPLLETALRDDTASPDLNFMLGETLLRMQQPEKAIRYLEAAVHSSDAMLPAHASLGFALSQTGRASEAIAHLERALPIDEDGSLHYQLARAYQGAGNTARSQELMLQYQQITARNQSVKDEVAKEAEIVAP